MVSRRQRMLNKVSLCKHTRTHTSACTFCILHTCYRIWEQQVHSKGEVDVGKSESKFNLGLDLVSYNEGDATMHRLRHTFRDRPVTYLAGSGSKKNRWFRF